ncbi:MAG: T9SS type A sorting domain-containing protein, partial [Bacteroidetes bacterium]|nr:T9SS type A sorting domain-containing protein [Bacteroidota bacterium]
LNPELKTGKQTNLAIGETWTLIPSIDITDSITIRMQWNGGINGTYNSELTSFDRTQCMPIYWKNGSSTKWVLPKGNKAKAAQGSDPYWIDLTLPKMEAGATYYFGIMSGSSALPVELIHFDAQQINNAEILIEWTTSSETNNSHFLVERNLNNNPLKWETIATISGFGTSNEIHNYYFTDSSTQWPLNENTTLYYRLKQIDYDGKFEYSIVKTVVLNNVKSKTDIYPNPFSECLLIESNSSFESKILIYNQLGEMIFSQPIQKNQIINTSLWTPGVYIIRDGANARTYLKPN